MRFAQRTDWELTPNKISGILNDFRKQGETIWDLTESNPTACGFHYPQEAILGALSKPTAMTYSVLTQGLLGARQAIVDYYAEKNIPLSVEQIFLTASTSEAYSFLFRLLANPGELILLPRPSYPLFDFLVDLNDLQGVYYSLNYINAWAIDFAQMGQTLNSKIKALVTVNPNNPTGSFIKESELAVLNTICQKSDCTIISDEVFFDYGIGDHPEITSLAGNRENLTFTLSGLSKVLGLPQMKLSWIVVNGPDDIVRDAMARLEMIADTYLSVNTPVQNALTCWMSYKSRIQTEILNRVQSNRDVLQQYFADRPGVSVLQSEGGWYMILKLPAGIDEEEFTRELLRQDRVYVHPGYFFNFINEPYVIVSLLPPEDIFAEGVKRITARLKN